MIKYVFKRLGYMITVFFVVSFLMYCVYNLIPGDPAAQQLEEQKQKMTPEAYQAAYESLRETMGLDDPIVVRYARWMGLVSRPDGTISGLLEGNFGYSLFYKNDVAAVIPRSMTNTVMLNIFSTILALGITIPLGIYSAVHKKGKVDQVTQVVTIVGYSIPIYIVALLCIWLVPGDGRQNPRLRLHRYEGVPGPAVLHVPACNRHDAGLPGRHDPLCPRRYD